MSENLLLTSKVLLWSNHGYYVYTDFTNAIGLIANLADFGEDLVIDEKNLME